MAQKAGRIKIKNREKVMQALELRKSGMTYSQIGTAMGISNVMAHRYVVNGLAELTEVLHESAKEVRELEVNRLDAIIEAHWNARGDFYSAQILLKAQERRAKLLGLDAPAKVAETDAAGNDLPAEARTALHAKLLG